MRQKNIKNAIDFFRVLYYNEIRRSDMKKFRFKYPAVVWVLLAIVFALSVAGLIWNVYNFISFVNSDTVKTVLYSVIILLVAFLVVLTISVAVYGMYVIKGDTLYSYFGLVRSKFDINDITEITHFKKSDKLVVYFSDAKYTVIVIDKTDYDDFVVALREVNRKIIFDKKIEGEDTPD